MEMELETAAMSGKETRSPHLAAYKEYQNAIDRVLNEGIGLFPTLMEEMEIRLFHFAIKGDSAQVSVLLDKGICVNAVDYDGRTALHLASDRGNLETVELLLSRSANTSILDRQGETALSLAARAKQIGVIKILNGLGSIESAAVSKVTHKTRLMKASFTLMEAFPHSIASAMLDGRKIEPINKDTVSLMFSDIVGFTALSSTMSAERVSNMLSRLFKRFDRLAHLHGVQKIDVVGDAYIAATNFMEDQVRARATSRTFSRPQNVRGNHAARQKN